METTVILGLYGCYISSYMGVIQSSKDPGTFQRPAARRFTWAHEGRSFASSALGSGFALGIYYNSFHYSYITPVPQYSIVVSIIPIYEALTFA